MACELMLSVTLVTLNKASLSLSSAAKTQIFYVKWHFYCLINKNCEYDQEIQVQILTIVKITTLNASTGKFFTVTTNHAAQTQVMT